MTRTGKALQLVLSILAGAVGGVAVLAVGSRGTPWPSYATLFDEAAPCVVNVSVELPDARVGSGFAVSDREVVTALHIVLDAEAIVVRDVQGRALRAHLLGSDARSDLALLEVAEGGLSPALLGSTARLRVGDPVVAIGNPYGLGHSLAAGVVGHRGRRLSAEADAGPRVDFVQLSIPLNPGNSGGPVFDVHGRVVGVLSGTHAQGQAIAFAVPVEVVQDGLPALRSGAQVSRAFLGLRGEDVDGRLLVASVTPHGPADRAGILVGDAIVAVDGAPVPDKRALQATLDAAAGGAVVTMTVRREGVESDLRVELSDWAEQPVVAAGMTLRAAPGAGGEVLAVRPRSRAEAAGILVGDRVRAVDGVPVRAPADVKDALAGGTAVQVELVRGGVPVSVQMEDAG